MTSKANRERPERGFLGLLRTVARIVVVAGAVGSIGLMLKASQHPPHFLLILFVIWVLSPFVALLFSNMVSKRWSVLTRATFYSVTLVVTLGSLAVYGHNFLKPPRSRGAFVFVAVPLASWLVISIVLPIAAFISRRLLRRGAGANRDVEGEVPINVSPKKQMSGLLRIGRWIFRAFAFLVTLGIFGVAGLFASLRLERGKEITLPTPTGSFAVGRTIYAWADDTPDTLAPVPGTKRELIVWIWYPSATGQSPATMEDYLPAPWRTAFERENSALFKLLTRDLSLVHTHSNRDADVSPQERSYPVVIMRGGASANVTNYSTLAEDLASHGYIVVGVDAPYRTNVVVFPDGRVMTRTRDNNPELCLERMGQEQSSCINRILAAWTADMKFVLDRLEQLNTSDASGKFTGRLDMTRVGVFGHSFGGAQAAQFCSEDSRCKAGIDIDGAPLGSVIQTGLHQPFMFLLSAQIESSDPESRQVKGDIQWIYDRLPADGRLRVEIRGANHFTFSDDGALLKSDIVRWALRLFGKLGIDGPRQLAVTAYCVHSFFDAHLKGAGVSKLEISSPLYPEIQVLE